MTAHDPGIAWYDRNAAGLAEQYEGADFPAVHGWLFPLLDGLDDGPVLDIGAGSGRDAAWFAARGHTVVAVEPAAGLRAQARERHPEPSIEWLDDRLPDLEAVQASGRTFSLILLSAVWMHVPPADRERAFKTLISLLRPGGLLAVTLRLGEPDTERGMAEVSAEELTAYASAYGLEVAHNGVSADALGRPEVSWGEVALRKPG
ncbi:MAG: class I SAM-dependent methyltransferase [Thiohalospira sp.]